MENISAHISYREATFSITAIRNVLDNTPNDQQLANMKMLADKVIEPAREYISARRGIDTAIQITSFLRRPLVNKAVGGSKTSQHCAGEESLKKEAAADIETNYPDFTKKDLFMTLKERGGFDQLIWEFQDPHDLALPAWVHVSYRDIADGGNRGEVFRAIVENEETKYIPFA